MSRVLLASLAIATTSLLSGCGTRTSQRNLSFTLPDKMIAGYTSGANATVVVKAVEAGVNVIFWSFMQWNNNSLIGGVKAEVVAPIYQALVDAGHSDVPHFVSFGGWNEPHHVAGTCGGQACSGKAYASAFEDFNKDMMKNVPGFPGFAGIDWDLEGMDSLDAPSNVFSTDTYELMIDISQRLRQNFYISMVPAQSYFDCTTSGFDSSLRHPSDQGPDSWTYHGLNTYTVLYAKCPECFDLVMVQWYEGYALAGFDLYWDGVHSNLEQPGWPRAGTAAQVKSVVTKNLQCLVDGWKVDFDGYMGLPNGTLVKLPAEKVVGGMSNGWAGVGGSPPYKFPFFAGTPSGDAFCAVRSGGASVRGFAYWDISDDSTGTAEQQAFVHDLSTAMACVGIVV